MFDFTDMNVVITGAGASIGRGTAQMFAGHGAMVMAVDIDGDAAQRTADEAKAAGHRMKAIQADVGDEASVDGAFALIRSQFATVHGLVNVAGIELYKDYLDFTDAEWDRQIAVNLKSVFLCTRRVIPMMIEQDGGSIVSTASVQALATTGRITPYAAAKGGIIAMSRDIAQDFGPKNIRINTICPGVVRTPMLDRSFGDENERHAAIEALAGVLPLRRIGEPSDFANLAMFLISPLSSYITGQAIAMDGGMMCRLPLA